MMNTILLKDDLNCWFDDGSRECPVDAVMLE